MKGLDGRVYTPWRVRLRVDQKWCKEYGHLGGAIEMLERDPLPELGSPTHWFIDIETARMLASDLTAAASRLERRRKAKSQHPADHEYVSIAFDVCDRCGWSRSENQHLAKHDE